MKNTFAQTIAGCLLVMLLLVGCGQNGVSNSGLIAQGELVTVELLDKPFPPYAPYQLSFDTLEGGTVEIYEDFIVTTQLDGVSRVAPHDWYRNLRFKK